MFPGAIAVHSGNIYLSDSGRLRRVNSAGIITTVAGTGTSGYSGDGGLATVAQVSAIRGICIDASGNIFFSDSSNNRIRKVTSDGIITTVAGTGTTGFSGDGGPATAAQLNRPAAVTVASDGTLYFADASNRRIRRITPAGIIETIAGTGDATSGIDGALAIETSIASPVGLALDSAGNVYFTALGRFIRKVDTTGILTTIAGNGVTFSGDGGLATAALLNVPQGLVADANGNLYIGDSGNNRVRKVTPDGVISTIAGTGGRGFSGDGGPATSAQLDSPADLAMDEAGNLYIADVGNFRIRRVTPNGTITTVAGSGLMGDSGDGGPATSAKMGFISGLAADAQGNFFISDFEASRVRKITSDGIISTVAGTGASGFDGDDGPGVSSRLNSPGGLSADADGNLYIADGNNQRIRKLDANGILTTVAGGGTSPLFNDGEVATSVQIGASSSVSADPTGNIYIDRGCSIFRIDRAGLLTRVAGAACGIGGDGGPATLARIGASLSTLYAAVDPTGSNLYIAEVGNNRVRRVQLTQQTSYAIPNEGGNFSSSAGARAAAVTGYGRIRPLAGSTPSGVAIYAYRSGNVLLSETGVPATRALTSGRIYAEFQNSVNTGLAIVNPTSRSATVTFYYTDAQGNDVGSGSMTIGANSQTAKFINELPFRTFSGNTFRGTFTFSSNVPVSAIAIRSFDNERHDFLMSTLPVIDLSAAPSTGTTVVPHFAAGGDWSTQLLLVNATNAPLTGTIEFRDDDGNLLSVALAEQVGTAYSVPARSSRKLTVLSSTLLSGSVRIAPSGGGVAPVPLVVFSSRPGGLTLSEAGVNATRGSAFRMYAEQAGSVQTALAIANNGASTASVFVELYNLNGSSTGLPTVVLSIPPFGHTSKFLSQLFQGYVIPSGFKGIVRVSTTSTAGVSVVELRAHYNERSDFLITTLPATDESDPPWSGESYFPQIADGGNYSMQFILFNTRGGSSSGTVSLFSPSGGTLEVPLN